MTDDTSWEAWASMMEGMAFPGWATCRFACLGTPEDGPPLAVFVNGIARGPFGIWAQTYDICTYDGEGKHETSSDALFNLTHLPSGKCVGLFSERGDAAFAAEIAARACPEWVGAEVENSIRARTVECWGKMGLTTSQNAHAHDRAVDVGPLGIIGLSPIEEGKPERLS